MRFFWSFYGVWYIHFLIYFRGKIRWRYHDDTLLFLKSITLDIFRLPCGLFHFCIQNLIVCRRFFFLFSCCLLFQSNYGSSCVKRCVIKTQTCQSIVGGDWHDMNCHAVVSIVQIESQPEFRDSGTYLFRDSVLWQWMVDWWWKRSK